MGVFFSQITNILYWGPYDAVSAIFHKFSDNNMTDLSTVLELSAIEKNFQRFMPSYSRYKLDFHKFKLFKLQK